MAIVLRCLESSCEARTVSGGVSEFGDDWIAGKGDGNRAEKVDLAYFSWSWDNRTIYKRELRLASQISKGLLPIYDNLKHKRRIPAKRKITM